MWFAVVEIGSPACDYSLYGCGVKFSKVKADSFDALFREIMGEDYGLVVDDEQPLKQLYVFPCQNKADYEVDLTPFRKAAEEARVERRQKSVEQAERAMLTRLKKKYESPAAG